MFLGASWTNLNKTIYPTLPKDFKYQGKSLKLQYLEAKGMGGGHALYVNDFEAKVYYHGGKLPDKVVFSIFTQNIKMTTPRFSFNDVNFQRIVQLTLN